MDDDIQLPLKLINVPLAFVKEKFVLWGIKREAGQPPIKCQDGCMKPMNFRAFLDTRNPILFRNDSFFHAVIRSGSSVFRGNDFLETRNCIIMLLHGKLLFVSVVLTVLNL